MAKNITLAVDEELLAKIRRLAGQRDTTVNAMVREHFEALAQAEEDREKSRVEALDRLKELSKNSGIRLGADYAFTREDAYDEARFR